MAKYLIDSTDIEIEEVSGTENLKLNLANGNSVEQMIGDLSNLTTTNKSNVVNAINEVNSEVQNKNLEYIVATINNTQSVSGTYNVILNNIYASQGNFTLNSGKIVIGSEIHHIRVSGSVFIEQWTPNTSYLWTIIRKNSSSFASCIMSSNTSFLSTSVPTTIVEVEENDTIYFLIDTNGSGNIRTGATNTWLCVEKID